MLQVVNSIGRALRRVDGRRDWRRAGRIIYLWAAMQMIRAKLARIVAARWLRRRARLIWAHGRLLYWTTRQAMHKAAVNRRDALAARERLAGERVASRPPGFGECLRRGRVAAP